jgi:hypothetical protein
MSSLGLPEVTLTQTERAGDRDPRERQYTGAGRAASPATAIKRAPEPDAASDLDQSEDTHELDERA